MSDIKVLLNPQGEVQAIRSTAVEVLFKKGDDETFKLVFLSHSQRVTVNLGIYCSKLKAFSVTEELHDLT